MSPQEIDTLRKEVKKLMIDLDLDARKKGSMAILAENLSRRMGKRISRTTLSMTLSGFRDTTGYQAILKEMKEMLAASLIERNGGNIALM